MTKFTENLWRDLEREHGPALAQAVRPGQGRVRRPGVIAGGTLALAVAGTALGLGLTSTGGTPAGVGATGGTRVVTDAYTITQNSSGSVVVQINQSTSLPAANAKLLAMGIHEQVAIHVVPGAAAASGPVACTPSAGASGPAIKVLLGTNGTEVTAPGTTGDNSGAGTWSLAGCSVTNNATGNSGTSTR